MPLFQGTQGVHIHSGDFHDIVGNHATYNRNYNGVLAYSIPSHPSDWMLEGTSASNSYLIHTQPVSSLLPFSICGSQDTPKNISNQWTPQDARMAIFPRCVPGIGRLKARHHHHPIEQPRQDFLLTDDQHEDCPWRMTTLTPGFRLPQSLLRVQSGMPSPWSARLRSNNPFLKISLAQEARELSSTWSPSAALSDEE